MRILESAFYAIVDHIGAKPAESGGALYGREGDYLITRFVPDLNAKTSRSTYTMDTEQINATSQKLWEEERLLLVGIIHSHPRGHASLSMPDRAYFAEMMAYIKRRVFFAPIAFTVPDGGFQVIPHVLSPSGDVLGRTTIELVPDTALVNREDRMVEEHSQAPEVMEAAAPAPLTEVEAEPRWHRIFNVMPDPTAMKHVVEWGWQALKAILIMLLAWMAVSITPALISFITNFLTQ